ncbi:MAG: DNA ligase D [Clostridiales bacterium]|nr:DNA ligase D [Clostridiales bacterium]
MSTLTEYKEKRDFSKTKEPTGAIKTSKKTKTLHYVIQHHLARRDHYDLRLEWQGVLLSWAVPKGPSYSPSDKRLAIEVEPHPFDYKDFEGTIPKGEYGGGTVMLWDNGYWEPVYEDVDKALKDGVIKFILHGKRLKGRWALIRLDKKQGETKDNWLLVKDKDEFAKDSESISQYQTSVVTGRTMNEIESNQQKEATKNPIDSVDVQLAKLVDVAPQGDNWVFEPKYDGYRIVAFVENQKARLMTRNGKDYTKNFKEIAISLESFAKNRAMILDGEAIIVDDEGKSDFQALQNYIKNANSDQITYVVFDILALDGKDLRDKPLIERKEILQELMKNAPANLYFSKHIKGKGKSSFVSACEHNLEGIIGKKANSQYTGSRNGDWIKLKCDRRQEFVVGGYTVSDKQTNGLSSVLVGYFDNGKLIYAGRAGTGFTEKDRKELSKNFSSLIIDNMPFVEVKDKRSNEQIFWLKPEIVAEIKFAEWTKDNLLRQASFKGLRIDKVAKDVKKEVAQIKELTNTADNIVAKKKENGEIEIYGVKVTNPDRVVFDNPPTTKAEIVEYYAKVSEQMLEFTGGRILSTIRCPKGVNEPCFFKKHPGKGSKNIVVTPVETKSGAEDYFYIDNPKGFVYEAQMGTLEFHTWGSKVDSIEKPDMMVFDLDPDEKMELDKIRQGVKDLKRVLEKLSLIAFLKVSGGKGYHVVVPFVPSVDWETFSTFAKRVAQLMENKWPNRYTSNIRKNKREGKIFIDWVRNGRGATSIAPYSIRARVGAKVAMPISWEELDSVAPDAITMQEAIKRLAKPHPWKDYHKIKQSLKI